MEIRIGVVQRQTLIEARCDQSQRRGFGFAADIVPRELKRSAWTDETLLADAEFISEADRRKPWDNDRTHRNVAVSRDDFESAADVHRVAPRLVNANHDDLLAFVIRRRAHGSNAGPVENADTVEIALRLQHLLLAERVA